MAHFAQLDENNVVINVVKVVDEVLIDQNGNENEQLGIDFLNRCQGYESRWVQTSYNANMRHRYAVIGGHYDPDHNVFLRQKPVGCSKWVLNPSNYEWEPPIPKPNDEPGYTYSWDDENGTWVKIRVIDPPPTEDPGQNKYWRLDGYSWVLDDIPPKPDTDPEEGYKWEFFLGRWQQLSIEPPFEVLPT